METVCIIAAIDEVGSLNTAVRVLVVDDDPEICNLLAEYLSTHGYEVTLADCGEAMRAEMERAAPAVVLLDVGLPDEDGLSLARFLRERYEVGIIMITGADEVVDRVVGLEVGADDYITKPFDLREVRARLRSVLRRMQGKAAETPRGQAAFVPVGRCRLDLRSHQLADSNGREVGLTAMEFDLLKALTRKREWEPFDRSVDILIGRLRRKLEEDPGRPSAIRTIRGAGYMFVPRVNTIYKS